MEAKEGIISLEIKGRVPSAKNHMQLVKIHGRVIPIKSKAYQRFKHEAIQQLREQYKNSPIQPTELTVNFFLKGKIDADLDNLVATICDILQDALIIENDKTITTITATKQGHGSEFYTKIFLGDIESDDKEKSGNR